MDNWLKDNTVLKILSLLLAVMLWMVVNMDQDNPAINSSIKRGQNTYFYEAKVTPIYDENEFVVDMLTEEVKVTLRGDQEVINQLRNGVNIDKGQFFVDLTDYKAGTYAKPIEYRGFPSGIEVEVQPNLIQVKLEAKERKEFDVLVDKLGKEKDGYQSGEPVIKPKRVHISGTKEQIEKVAFVKAFVNIDQVESPVLQQIPLRALDKNGNVVVVEIVPQTVEVQIPVTSPYIDVPVTYNIAKYPPSGYGIASIQQLTKKVTLYGSKDVIERYNVYIGPNVDLSNLKEGKHTITAKIPLDPNLLKTEPNMLELEITIIKSETKTINQVPVEIHGLSSDLSAEIITPKQGVNIILEGAPNVLEQITLQELQAFVDVTNLPPGEHELEIKYNVPLLTKQIGEKQTAIVKIKKE